MVSEQQKTVIITDLHGYSDKLQAAVGYYGEDTRYILSGDFINKGPDSKGVMDILAGLDTELLIGNHELMMFASLYEADPERRRLLTDEAWLRTPKGRVERQFLESYGIPEYGKASDTQEATRERLQELGHYAMFQGMEMYHEDEELIIVHAGLNPKESWAKQRGKLDEAGQLKEAHYFVVDLPPIFDHKLSQEVQRPDDVDKTLITGHVARTPGQQRIWRVGSKVARVMLDSSLTKGNPLLVYECWDSSIRVFE